MRTPLSIISAVALFLASAALVSAQQNLEDTENTILAQSNSSPPENRANESSPQPENLSPTPMTEQQCTAAYNEAMAEQRSCQAAFAKSVRGNYGAHGMERPDAEILFKSFELERRIYMSDCGPNGCLSGCRQALTQKIEALSKSCGAFPSFAGGRAICDAMYSFASTCEAGCPMPPFRSCGCKAAWVPSTCPDRPLPPVHATECANLIQTAVSKFNDLPHSWTSGWFTARVRIAQQLCSLSPVAGRNLYCATLRAGVHACTANCEKASVAYGGTGEDCACERFAAVVNGQCPKPTGSAQVVSAGSCSDQRSLAQSCYNSCAGVPSASKADCMADCRYNEVQLNNLCERVRTASFRPEQDADEVEPPANKARGPARQLNRPVTAAPGVKSEPTVKPRPSLDAHNLGPNFAAPAPSSSSQSTGVKSGGAKTSSGGTTTWSPSGVPQQQMQQPATSGGFSSGAPAARPK